jgi:hypothetical protein
MENNIIITIIVCGTALFGYIFRLLFLSKCETLDLGCLHIKRNTAIEKRNVEGFSLPISLKGMSSPNDSPQNNPETKITVS